MRRQQGGGGVLIWGGLIGNAIIGPFHVPEGLKLSLATYCSFLEPWLDNLPLARLKKIIFMHDNALSHAAKATTQFIHSLGVVNETLMVWPPNLPDLNPIDR